MKPERERNEQKGRGGRGWRRRGAVAAYVAISMTLIMGIAALVIDLSMLYNARAELQRSADAAAMAAALHLSDFDQGSPLQAARNAAQTSLSSNRVLNSVVQLSNEDVEFGRAFADAGNHYTFTPTEQYPNAVRVRVRRTADSVSGAVPLLFANIFGIQRANVGARAAAVLVPRDICFVLDLSSSHNDDSSLRAFRKTPVYSKPVWEYMKDWPGALTPRTDSMGFNSKVRVVDNGDGTSRIIVDLTSDGSRTTSALSHITFGLPSGAQTLAAATASSGHNYPISIGTDPTTGVSGLKFDETTLGEDGVVQTEQFSFTMENSQMEGAMMTLGTKAGTGADTSVQYNLSPGPTIGNLNHWGTDTPEPGWNYSNDPGLVRIPKGTNSSLSSAFVSQTIQSKGLGTYTSAEMSVINSASGDSSTTNYRRRVRIALGIDRWKSGKSGGQPGGDGDNVIDSNEVVNVIPYPSGATNPITGSKEAGGDWDAWIDYVSSSSASMCTYDPNNQYFGDPNLRYRFGLKTWIDYLQEDQEGTDYTPGLDGAPTQPMGAVTTAVQTCLDIIQELHGNDLVGSAAYGDVGYGPAQKPNNLSWLRQDPATVRDQVGVLQAGMWTHNTCMAGGVDKGVEVLFNSPEQRPNAAKVMLLLTDGQANWTKSGRNSVSTATAEARASCQTAANKGVQIYTISVGVSADTDLMEDLAQIGGGEHFHAEGDVDTYRAQLQQIFEKLGGKRPVVLFE